MLQVEEEAGFNPEELEYVRSGRPLTVTDKNICFEVRPYLFNLLTNRQPVLNWENDEAHFFEPHKLAQLHTVPRLYETYERVELEEDQFERYSTIETDRSHGAAQLSLIAIDQLRGESIHSKVTLRPLIFLNKADSSIALL